VSEDAPSLESVYKLVAYDGRPVMKLSPGKATAPGPKQVFRGPAGDVVGLREEPPPPGTEALLVPVMREGRRVAAREPVEAARRRFEADLPLLPDGARRLRDPVPSGVDVSSEAEALTTLVHHELGSRDHASEV
jgi:nicotinate phosphoribosyltransferase